jgi:hypothetical protein
LKFRRATKHSDEGRVLRDEWKRSVLIAQSSELCEWCS